MHYFRNGILGLVFTTTGFIGGVSYASQAPAADVQSVQTYDLMIDEGSDRLAAFENVSFTSGEPLLASLEFFLPSKQIPLSVKEYAGLGKLVTRIGSAENGMDDRYWQYWVNGRQLPVGAGEYMIQAGDVVLWKFARSIE